MNSFIKIIGLFSLIFAVGLSGIILFVANYDYKHIKPIIEQAIEDATGRKLSIQGDIYFHIGWTPGIRMSKVTFENASWSPRDEMLKVGQLQLDIQLWPLLKKTIQIKRLILENLYLSIEVNKDGKSNLEFKALPNKKSQSASPEKSFSIPKMGFQNVCLKTVHLSYNNMAESKQITMTVNQINAHTGGLDKPVSMDLIGVYRNHSFDSQATLGSINSFMNPKKKWSIKLSARGGGMDVTIHGYIMDVLSFKDMTLNLRCKGKQLESFQKMIETSFPINGPYEIQMAFSEQADSQYKAAFDLFLGENKLKGLGELYLNRSRPGIKLVLEADKIDLRGILDVPEKSKNKTSNDKDFFSKEPLLSESLSPIDFVAIIRIHTLITNHLAIHDINTKIHLTPDYLKLNPISASIGGGKISGQLLLDNQQSKGEITANIVTKNMNIGQMLKELDITEAFEGIPDINIDLKTQGRSMHEWMASLCGNIILQMGEGKIYNKYLNIFGGELSSNLLRLINPLRTKHYSLVHCLVSRLDIQDGKADITMLMLDSDQMSVLGAGNINLGNETLDISIKPLPKIGLDTGRLGKYSLSLSELAQPFELGGTLKHPRIKMDLSKAAWTFGKAVGGMMLFGPAGIAVSLISGVADDKNPCELAREVARTGKYPEIPYDQKSLMEKTQESVQKGMNDVGKGISDTWKQILGQ